MVKMILGIVAGYIAMSVVLFLLFSGLYLVLGTSGSFNEGSYYVSTTWLLAGFIIFYVGAAVAGSVSALIGKDPKSAFWMGGVILILGILIAISQIVAAPDDTTRKLAEVPMMDAMNLAQQPVWALFVNPIMGFIGALAGGKLVNRKAN